MTDRFNQDPKILDKFKVISINDPEDPILFNNFNKGDYGHLVSYEHPNLLSIVFHDVSYPSPGIEAAGYLIFNSGHAEDIINFLDKCEPTDNLIVHCFLGVSRSGAVGIFARELFNADYDYFKRANPVIVPNVLILKLLSETYTSLHGKPHTSSVHYGF